MPRRSSTPRTAWGLLAGFAGGIVVFLLLFATLRAAGASKNTAVLIPLVVVGVVSLGLMSWESRRRATRR